METTKISIAAQADINELSEKIRKFRNGEIDEDRFKAFRLARGVYGQRQQGVQMFRLKLPYGKITADQLRVIANLSETYTNGSLHLTTRQNIQLHYVKLEDSPKIWEAIEEAGVTAREACGNTVRNITASPFAGIDPNEPFDVTPYVQAVFEYFLRNPVCQDMGRKIKIAFSASQEDAAFTYIHDFGFTPVIKDGQRGFKVLIAGGLGAQAMMAILAYEFLPTDQLIPFIEGSLRVFDRYGERERRHKARLKFLLEPKKGMGLDEFLALVDQERTALPYKSFEINTVQEELPGSTIGVGDILNDEEDPEFLVWLSTNLFEQKQGGVFAVKVRVPLGNLHAKIAYQLADIVDKYGSPDLRITVNQGFLIRNVKPEHVRNVYHELNAIGLGAAGFDTLADVTACPGTDTCNLGVTNSTAVSLEIENMIREEYPHLVDETLIKIKISGCMNSCGQHMVGNIGFHGSSLKYGEKVAPAMQVVIGGGVDPDGIGRIAEKVIKLPTKRILDCIRYLLDDYEANAEDQEYFNAYFRRKGKIYFYDLLKPLADLSTLDDDGFQDWGKVDDFVPLIGVGECAGVMMDLVGTILMDVQARLESSQKALDDQKWANAIYYSYNAFVIGAKAMLLSKDIQCNTHQGIITDFQANIQEKGLIDLPMAFEQLVAQINQFEPTEAFAGHYHAEAQAFFSKVVALRKAEQSDKLVINEFYKA